MRNKRNLIFVMLVLAVFSFVFSGCQTRSEQASPVQLYIEEWDPLITTVYRTGAYDPLKATILATSYSTTIDIEHAMIKTITIEAYVGGTKVSFIMFKTDVIVPVNDTGGATFDNFPMNWPALTTYLNSHGAVTMLTFKVIFEGEDSTGKSLYLESEISGAAI